jgi:hypothetical protein
VGIAFPSQLEPFLDLAPGDLPVPTANREWVAFSLIEESAPRDAAPPTAAESALNCLDTLGGIGTSLVRVFLFEAGYERALGPGQANDLYQRLYKEPVQSRAGAAAGATRVSGKPANGAAQESNLPSVGLPRLTGFEDRLGHQAHAAPRQT